MADEEIEWRRPAADDTDGCLEVHHGPDGGVYLRNSTDLLHMIRLPKSAWDAFLAAVVAGEFD
jgi:uncharacterized protein DUF397